MNVSYRQFEQSTRSVLRDATAVDHEMVDAAFGQLRVATRRGYTDFLLAHARILPLAERLIDPGTFLENWSGRAQSLLEDLAELGAQVPPEIDFSLPDGEAARLGALYVLEGSRLGGSVIVRSVPSRYPSRFLRSCHPKGAWQKLLNCLEEADSGPAWQRDAVAGARSLFGAYLRSVRTV